MLDDLIEQIYASAVQPLRWGGVLQAFTQAFHGESATLEVHDKRRGQLTFFEGHAVTEWAARVYAEHFFNNNPRVTQGLVCGLGEVQYDHAILRERDMDRNEYYQDFLAPQGLRYFLSTHVVSDATRFGVLAVHRSRQVGHIDEEDIARIKRLTSHVQRALAISARLSEKELFGDHLAESLCRLRMAAVLVDEVARVSFMNPAAERALAAGQLLECRDGRLQARSRRDQRALRDALRAAIQRAPGETTVVLGAPPGPTITLSVCGLPSRRVGYEIFSDTPPIRASAFVVFDPAVPEAAASSLPAWGLTAAEVELAIALARGETLSDYAERHGVTRNTARTHLARVRSKLGVRTQAQVVRLVLRSLPPTLYRGGGPGH